MVGKKKKAGDGAYHMSVTLNFRGISLAQATEIEAFIKDGLSRDAMPVKTEGGMYVRVITTPPESNE